MRFGVGTRGTRFFYILVSSFSLLTIPYPYHTHTIQQCESAIHVQYYQRCTLPLTLYTVLYAAHCIASLCRPATATDSLACFILQNQLEKTTINRIPFDGLQTIRCKLFGAFGSVGWYRALYLCRRGTDSLQILFTPILIR